MDLVTIAVFNTSVDAHLAMGRLEADGIECFLKDDNTIQINPLYNIALGGIKLQVVDADVEIAVANLRELNYPTVFDTSPPTEKKPYQTLISFLKYFVAVVIVLGMLYFMSFHSS